MAKANTTEKRVRELLDNAGDPLFEPQNQRLVVFTCEFLFPGQVESELITPDTAQDRPETGVIVAAPHGSDYAAGTKILFGKYSSYNLPGAELVVITEADVIAILRADLPIREQIDVQAEIKEIQRASRIVVPEPLVVSTRR